MMAHLYMLHSNWEIKHVTETLQGGLFYSSYNSTPPAWKSYEFHDCYAQDGLQPSQHPQVLLCTQKIPGLVVIFPSCLPCQLCQEFFFYTLQELLDDFFSVVFYFQLISVKLKWG